MTCTIVIATILREHGETGAQTHFNALRAYLTSREAECHLVTPFSSPWWLVYPIFAVRKVLDRLSGPASVWWYRYWHYLFLKLALRQTLVRHPSAMIYAQCPLSARAALLSRREPNQRVVMVAHFNVSQADEWAGKGKIKPNSRIYQSIKQLEREVLPALDGIVYVSEFMQRTIERDVPRVAQVKATVVPNFITSPDPDAARMNRGTRDLVSIGTLEPRKNQSYLLRVLAEAEKRGRRYSLTLIGDGPDRATLQALARSLGIEQQVCFAGFQKDAARFLPEHRAYVHAAHLESQGIALVEALSHGLPVFAAPGGGIPEVFSDGIEGFYWSLDDPGGGAEKLITLLEDPDQYDRVARAAGVRFRTHFDARVVAGRLTAFLCAP